jgi:sec-independent protein translocase protein TatC
MARKSTVDKRKEMPFLDHLEELRWRILKSLIALIAFSAAAFPLTDLALKFLTLPNERLATPAKLIFLKPTGMLMVRMEIAIALGVMLSLPVVIYQLWMFVSPGLLPKEKKNVMPVMLITAVCFLIGSSFAYFVMVPMMLRFLFGLGTSSIEAVININDYMSFLLRLILMTGLIFELPVLAFFLARIGLLKPAFLRKFRRIGIVLILILAAVITPTPDPFNMLVLAVPLYFLYEISIWVTVVAYRKKRGTAVKRANMPLSKKPRGKTNPRANSKNK